jgi:hypothetical protein
MPTFYTYMWLRYDGTPYYVGKGSGKRAYYRHARKGVTPPPDRERILVQAWPTEADAFEAEKFLIALYGRKDSGSGVLHNRSEGGEGPAGVKHPVRSREHVEKLRAANVGRKHSEETKARISEVMRGRKKPTFSEEHRRKIGEQRKNNPLTYSQEYRDKLSAAARKRWERAKKDA